MNRSLVGNWAQSNMSRGALRGRAEDIVARGTAYGDVKDPGEALGHHR
jgi:hypothetical protein